MGILQSKLYMVLGKMRKHARGSAGEAAGGPWERDMQLAHAMGLRSNKRMDRVCGSVRGAWETGGVERGACAVADPWLLLGGATAAGVGGAS